MSGQESNWLSLVPPLVAIVLSFVFRQAHFSLLLGVFLGCFLISDFNLFLALGAFVDCVGRVLSDGGHQKILAFSLLLGGLVGVIQISGGAQSFARWVARFATNKRRVEGMVWLSGLLLFIDDYANALLVGSSMRPVTDKHGIPREKLAFLVDATSAPVSSIALISSWIGVELGYIADQAKSLGLQEEPYTIFLKTLPYRFYPILMIAFCGLLIWRQVDLVSWDQKSIRGRSLMSWFSKRSAKIKPKANQLSWMKRLQSFFSSDGSIMIHKEHRNDWLNAAIPLLVLLFFTFGFMVLDGFYHLPQDASLTRGSISMGRILSHADTSKSLLVGTLSASVSAWVIVRLRKSLFVKQITLGWARGIVSLVKPCSILVLAWMLGWVCKELGTAQYLAGLLQQSLPVQFLPAMVFVVAALISFATGTSWGTMAVLFPVAIPVVAQLEVGVSVNSSILISAMASILSGSVWGDHCSPISDTTILSALSSGCDPLDHVRTQLPHAMAVGFISLVFGEIAVGFGLYSAWVGLIVGCLFLLMFVWSLGWLQKHRVAET